VIYELINLNYILQYQQPKICNHMKRTSKKFYTQENDYSTARQLAAGAAFSCEFHMTLI
jgi:hypothetical protein